MTILLDKVNTAPVLNENMSFEMTQWFSNTIDTLNEDLNDIEDVLISRELIDASITSVNASVNSLYIPTSAALTVFQLPVTTDQDIGSIIEIAGQGSGGWRLLTAVGQTIQIGDVGAVANTSISSSNRYNSIKIILVSASTWITLSTQTTGFVIV